MREKCVRERERERYKSRSIGSHVKGRGTDVIIWRPINEFAMMALEQNH